MTMDKSDRDEELMTATFSPVLQAVWTEPDGAHRPETAVTIYDMVRNLDDFDWRQRKRTGALFCRRQRGRAYVRSAVLLSGDLLAIVAANIMVLLLSARSPDEILRRAVQHSTQEGLAWHGWGTVLITLVLCAHLSGRGHYRLRITFWVQAFDIISACLLAFLCDVLLTTLLYREPADVTMLVHWFLLAALIVAGRSFARSLLDHFGVWRMRTVIIGDSANAERARVALTSDLSMGYEIVAQLAPQDVAGCREADACYRLMADQNADFLAIAGGPATSQMESVFMAALSLTRIPLTFIPPFTNIPVAGCDSQHVYRHDVMLLTSQPRWTEPLAHGVKSAFDYITAAVLCVVLAPLLGLIALCVRRDGGPVLFGQSRIGAGGRAFVCLKFRSMRVDAAERLAELLTNDPVAAREWATQRKLSHDPRTTPVGRFLRKTSLDELPQLLNVLRGEMSLVGPRPIVAAEVDFYGDFFRFYMHMKPGVTGLWQASGRSNTSYAERIRLDVWYARNWTLWQDFIIMMLTVPAVLFRRGAM